MMHILIGDPILWTFKTFPVIVAAVWHGQSNILPSLSREHKNPSWRTLNHLPEWLNLYTCCAVVWVCLSEKTANHLPVFTHTRPALPTTLCLSTVLLSSLTFSRFHNTLFKVIPFSGVSTMSDGHWKPKSATFQHRFISPHLPSGQSINTGARLLMLSLLTSFPWTSAPSARRTRISSIPLDLKAFASHHEARNSSVTLLVCFKPQWEPCAHVLWDWSPPWKKLFLIPVKQHGMMACASSEDLHDAFVFIIYVKKVGSDHVM